MSRRCEPACCRPPTSRLATSYSYFPSEGPFTTATLSAENGVLTVTDTTFYPLVNPHLTFTNPGATPLTINIPSLGIDTTIGPFSFITVPINVPGSYGSASFPYQVSGPTIVTLTAPNLRAPVVTTIDGSNSGVFISFYGLAGSPSSTILITNSGTTASSPLTLTFNAPIAGTLAVFNPDGTVLIPSQTLTPGYPITITTSLIVPPGSSIALPYSFQTAGTTLTLTITGTNFTSVTGPLPVTTPLVPGSITVTPPSLNQPAFVTLSDLGPSLPLLNPTLQLTTTDPQGSYSITLLQGSSVLGPYTVSLANPFPPLDLGSSLLPGEPLVLPFYITSPSSGPLAINAVFTLNGSNIVVPVSATYAPLQPIETTIRGSPTSSSLEVTNIGPVPTTEFGLTLSNPGPDPITYSFEGTTTTLGPGQSQFYPHLGIIDPGISNPLILPFHLITPGVIEYQGGASNTNIITGTFSSSSTIVTPTNQFIPLPVTISLPGPGGTIESNPSTNGNLLYTNVYPTISTTGTITQLDITGGTITINGKTYSGPTTGLSIPLPSFTGGEAAVPYLLTSTTGPVTVTVSTIYSQAPPTLLSFIYTVVEATVSPSSIVVSTPYNVPLGAGFLNVNVIQGAMTIDQSSPLVEDISLPTPGITNVTPSTTSYTITSDGAAILTYNYSNASPLVVNFPTDIILASYFTAALVPTGPVSGTLTYQSTSPLSTQPGLIHVSNVTGSLEINGTIYSTGAAGNISLPSFTGTVSFPYTLLTPGTVATLTASIPNLQGSPLVLVINGSTTTLAVTASEGGLGTNVVYTNLNGTVSLSPVPLTLLVASGNITLNGTIYYPGTYSLTLDPSPLVLPYTLSPLGIVSLTTAPTAIVTNSTALSLYGSAVLAVNNPPGSIIIESTTAVPLPALLTVEVLMGPSGGTFTIKDIVIAYDYIYVFNIPSFTGTYSLPYTTTGSVTVNYQLASGTFSTTGTLL